MKTYSEKELINRLNLGDEEAFLTIYDRYKMQLAQHLRSIFYSEEWTEEVLQEVFMMLWEKRKSIDPDKNVGGFLYQSAVNRVKNIFRKMSNDRKMRAEYLNHVNTDAQNVEQSLLQKDIKQVLNQLLHRLPPKQRKVFALCKIEGLSYKEVSVLLNISEATVNSHIRNANKLINKEIKNTPHLRDLIYMGIFLFL